MTFLTGSDSSSSKHDLGTEPSKLAELLERALELADEQELYLVAAHISQARDTLEMARFEMRPTSPGINSPG